MSFEGTPRAENGPKVTFNNYVNEGDMLELQTEFGLTDAELQTIIDDAPGYVGSPSERDDIPGLIGDYYREVKERLSSERGS